MLIRNAMVILIAVGEYDEIVNIDVAAKEILDVYLRNLSIEQDIKNMTDLFGPNMLNYDIYPKYSDPSLPRLEWKQRDIINLLKAKAEELNNNTKYDGLIVAVSGHGISGHICCSDYRLISKLAIHRIFSINAPRSRTIPRIFLFDSCEGNEERDGFFDEEESSNSGKNANNKQQQQHENNGDDIKEPEIQEYPKTFTEKDIDFHHNNMWSRDTKSVDYRLVQIHAANPGFQAKYRSDTGSYMLTGFAVKIYGDLEKNNGKNSKFISETMNELQQELEEKGQQHIQATYNDYTGYIMFAKNSANPINSMIEMSEIN